jgi:hypothetical protein
MNTTLKLVLGTLTALAMLLLMLAIPRGVDFETRNQLRSLRPSGFGRSSS